jgi:hypothetical protein
MSDELPLPDMSLALDSPKNAPTVSEWLLGTSAVLAYHLGKTDTARLIADVSSAEVRLWNTEFGQEGYRIVLVVEPHLYLPRIRNYGHGPPERSGTHPNTQLDLGHPRHPAPTGT